MTDEFHRIDATYSSIGIAALLLVVSVGVFAGLGAADASADAPAYELEIDNDGGAYAVGFPGPVEGSVDDVFVEGTDGVAAVYRYSPGDGAWSNVLEDDGVDEFDDVTVGPMDSLIVLTTGDGEREAIPLEVAFETQQGETVTPDQRGVDAGWNFVSSPQRTDADTVFGAGTAETSLVLDRYSGPRTVAVEQTPAFGQYYLDSGNAPETDPFAGYFVFAQDDGTIPTVASGITDRDDADAQLDLPTFDEVTVHGDITSGAEDGSLTDGDLTVRLDGEEIDIDDGEYEETLAPGEYTLTVEADGHQTATRELDARFATTYEEDVELEGSVVNRDGEKSYVSAAKAAEEAGKDATISLESGTYEEDLEITADGVTIEGASGVSLASTAAKTGETTVVGNIDIAADGVTIRDLSVHDGTVSASSSDDVALSGLDIIGETGTADPGVNSAGIEIEGGKNLSITDVAIDADYGISVGGVRTAELHGIDVTTDDGMGLVLYDATGVDLDGVTVDGANEAVGLVNVADSTVGNVAIEDSTLGLAVANESGSQTQPENITLTGDLELHAIVPYAEMTESTADPVEIDRPDGLTHAIRTSGVPVSVTGFTYDDASAIAGAVALPNVEGTNGQPLAEASAVQRLSDDVYVVAPETSLQDATDIADEDATIEVRGGTHEEGATIETDGITITGEDATFEETIAVDDTQGVTVDAVTVTDATNGILVFDSTDTTLTGVDTSGNDNIGLLSEGSDDVEISDATSSDNEYGLLNVQDDTSVSVVNSTFNGNDDAIINDGDGIVTVRNSTIVGNDNGAFNMDGATLDAAENWWGDASGPSGDADGTGDSVIGNVDYEPWLDAPPGDEPGGLEAAGVELSNFETDTTAADRGDTVTTSVDVTNAVESVGFSTMAIDDGAEFEVEYVLVDGKDEAQISSETVTVVAGETETVEFTESLPGSTTAHEERSVEHEIRIAGEGVGERADLELANPVQTAIDYADAAETNTVQVEPGTYDEPVDIDVDDLTVESAEGAEETTIASDDVSVTATNAALDGFTFESDAEDAVVDLAGDEATLANSVVDATDTADVGVAVGGSNAEITDTVVTGATDVGVRFADGATGGTVTQSDVVNNAVGVANDATGTVDAIENWWGSADGPGADGANGVTGDVDVAPWLDAPIPDGEPVVGDAAGTVTASGDTSEDDTTTEDAITTAATPGTDDPVADATVTVYPFDPDASGDETLEPIPVEENGEYTTADLPVGTHGFVADAEGFAAETQQVAIDQGVTTNGADFDLEYTDGGVIEGEVVLDEVDPDEDVTVTVALEGTDDDTTVALDADTDGAAFTIDDVDVDVDEGYTVTATADSDHYDTDETSGVEVDVGEAVDVGELTLERDTGAAEGTVTASGDTADDGAETNSLSTLETPGAGETVDDATVTVHYFDADASGDGDVTVDVTDGSFSVDQLPVGTHGFAVEGNGLEADTRDETIEDGSTTEDVDFDLDYAEGGALSGSVSIPEPADGDFPVDVTVLDGEDEVASEEVTIANGDSSTAYTFENVDVNVDDGYTVHVTTDAFGDLDPQDGLTVDVGEETGGVNVDLSDPVAQQVDVQASDTTVTVGEYIDFTATVTNDAGTPVEGVTVEASDDGEDVEYRDDESSQKADTNGEVSFEATTETEQVLGLSDDRVLFTFTEQDNGTEETGGPVTFEAGEAASFAVEDISSAHSPDAQVLFSAEDEYGNDVPHFVEIDASGFDELVDPEDCADADDGTCTTNSNDIYFRSDGYEEETVYFTETNSGDTDQMTIELEPTI